MNAALAFEPYTFEQGLEIKLNERYPDATISIFDVAKNNGVKLRALTIKQPHSNISPTIYIDKFREWYESTHDIDEICNAIVEQNEENAVEQFDLMSVLDFNKAKTRICAKLINKAKNEQLLKGIPHRDFLDLSVVYYVYLENFEGTASMLIRNDMLTFWNVEEEEIYTYAMDNSPRLRPVSFMSIEEVIQRMPDCTLTFEDEETEDEKLRIYVASSEQQTYGASVLLYPHFLQHVADTVQSDFYVIPSSLHEILIVTDRNEQTNQNELLEVVQEVNFTTVSDEEILADNVYFYSRESGELKAFF